MSLNVIKDFPALEQKINGKRLVYLDSAASALKPNVVIDRLHQYYQLETANVHRGAHYLADKGTLHYEQSREKIADFIGARSAQEIIFTKGTTDSLNLVVFAFAKNILKADDEVILSEMEHHANLVPWLMLKKEIGFQIKYIPVTANGELDLVEYKKLLNPKTKIVSVTHCSNTLGTINPIQEITKAAHLVNAYVVVDGAQYVVQDVVDVRILDCDFYAFSGHKLFGPYGIGVLYGKKEILEKMPPYQGGGSMIHQVSFQDVSFNDIPFRFEAGTPNISGAIALGTAVDYVKSLGFAKIHAHEQELLSYAQEKLQTVKNIKILGTAKYKAAIVSFTFSDMHHSDIGQILDQMGIAVRVGHHCTQPLLTKLGVTGTVRASFSIYNTKSDVDDLLKGLEKARGLLV